MYIDDLLPDHNLLEAAAEAPRPQRIAMLSLHTSPLAALGGRDTGGMNVYIKQLAEEFARRELQVDVYTRRADGRTPLVQETAVGFRTISLPVGPPAAVSRAELHALVPAWADAVDEFRLADGLTYDMLHSHYWLSGLAAERLAQRWEAPWAHMSHTLALIKDAHRGQHQEPESELRIASEAMVLPAADGVIASNDEERREAASRYGLDPTKIYVAPCGVDLELFHPGSRRAARTRLGLPLDGRIVLYVGRIEPLKGIDTLISAAAVLGQRVARLSVAIVGGSSDPADTATVREVDRLRALAERLGVSELATFHGPVEQRNLPDYYRAANVAVVPSHYESFGMAALESLACGVPVVASDVGGLRSTVRNGVNGYLAPADDERAFARRIERVLCRPELAAALSQEAARSARRYSWKRVADANLAVYHNLLAAAAPPEPTDVGWELVY